MTRGAAASAAKPVRRDRVHAHLIREIGLRIVCGEFAPKAVLPNEATWSAMFGVSRSAVRESIKVLSGKGLVLSRPKVGTTVQPREQWNLLDRDVLAWYAAQPPRREFLKTVQETRWIVEPEAAALAAARRSAAQMAVIGAACRDLGTASTLAERTDADVRFHISILRAAGNDFLVPFGRLIESGLATVFDSTTRKLGDLHVAQGLHERIEQAIRRRDPGRARRAVKTLLAHTDRTLFGVRSAPPAGKSRPG